MKKKDIFNGYTIFVVVVCLLTFTLNMINGRFSLGDFKVYYTASENFFSGSPVYMVSFYNGSGFYKYSPATLFFFLPYLIFSFKTAAIIHFFILGFVYRYAFIVIRKLIRYYFPLGNVKHEILLLSISFCCILIHFSREMYLGNINIILLLICSLAIRNFLTGKNLTGGILLGVAVLVKPYLLILMLPLVLRRKWKALTSLLLTVSVGFVIPFIYPGPLKGFAMYQDWIRTILMHSEDFPGKTSIDYFIRYLIPSWPLWGIAVILIISISLVTVFILNNIHKEKLQGPTTVFENMNFAFEWFLLVAFLPNLIKTDWVLLLYSAPLITFMVFNIAARRLYLWVPVLFILIFFYGANSDDLLGRELSQSILQTGLMGLSNFFLVICAFVMFIGFRKRLGETDTPFHHSLSPPLSSHSSARTSS